MRVANSLVVTFEGDVHPVVVLVLESRGVPQIQPMPTPTTQSGSKWGVGSSIYYHGRDKKDAPDRHSTWKTPEAPHARG